MLLSHTHPGASMSRLDPSVLIWDVLMLKNQMPWHPLARETRLEQCFWTAGLIDADSDVDFNWELVGLHIVKTFLP